MYPLYKVPHHTLPSEYLPYSNTASQSLVMNNIDDKQIPFYASHSLETNIPSGYLSDRDRLGYSYVQNLTGTLERNMNNSYTELESMSPIFDGGILADHNSQALRHDSRYTTLGKSLMILFVLCP